MLIFIYGASASGKSEYAEHLAVDLSQNEYRIYLATMENKGADNLKRIARHKSLREGKGFITIEAARNIKNILRDDYLINKQAKKENNKDIDNKNIDNKNIENRDLDNNQELIPCRCATVLLECLSNLVANEMFAKGDIIIEEIVKNKIINELNILNKKIKNLIIVSNNIFEDGNIYDEATNSYLRTLSAINEYLAGICDEAYEVVAGIPCPIKRRMTDYD